MKIKIKNFNGELPSYLTAGKVYEATGNPSIAMWITTDVGYPIAVSMCKSAFLNGGSWEIINE